MAFGGNPAGCEIGGVERNPALRRDRADAHVHPISCLMPSRHTLLAPVRSYAIPSATRLMVG